MSRSHTVLQAFLKEQLVLLCMTALGCRQWQPEPPLAYGAFPLQGAERIGSQRCGSGRVSTAKSGRDPDLAVPVLASFSGLLRWGTGDETPERVPGNSSYTPSVDWSTESSLPGDAGIKTN